MNVFYSRKVLRQEFEDAGEPGANTAVAIKFKGQRTSEGGRSYFDYQLLTEDQMENGNSDPSTNGSDKNLPF